ncbi:MAG: NAD-dependent epimerase/dehydratase family protein [Elusimicrobiota bacterium]|jgi:nucleoside-diphosphate-sugar epimerase|nr:NAD-dependent epimerase/dehydratase family protein [Elusimicrobiota bacterium]
MKILILGGTKFFGREFALLARRKGHDVTVFSRRAPAPDLPRAIKQIRGLRQNLSFAAGQKWDFVLDNICYLPEDMKEALRIFDGNIRHYAFVSSGDVHLAVNGAKSPFSETAAHNLSERRGKMDAYGKGKFEAEKILIASSLPYTIVRFPIVIGEGDPKYRLFSYLLRIWDGAPVILPDGGKYKRRFIYVKDAAEALYKVMTNRQKTARKIFHFGDKAVSLKSFIRICFKLSGARENIISIPSVWIKARGYEVATANPYFNPFDYVLGLNNAKRILAWRHSPMKKWLKKTIGCYRLHLAALTIPESYKNRKKEIELIKQYKRLS